MKQPEYFETHSLLYRKLESLHDTFDSNQTLAMSRYSFADKLGNCVLAYSMGDFCNNFNEHFGETFISAGCQIAGSQSYLMTFVDNVVSKKFDLPVQKEKEAVVATPLISLEPVVETPSEASQEAPESTIESSEYLPYDLIDWPRVEAFKNTKGDKAELATYASKYGVTLLKTKTIANMIEDFKSAVGV